VTERDLRGVQGQVHRVVLDKAGQAGLNLTRWKMLNAVLYFTVSYGRSTATVTTLRLATQFGVNPNGDERTRGREAGRALRWLRENGFIVYEPSRHEGSAGVVGVHPSLIQQARDTVSQQTPTADEGVPTDTTRCLPTHPVGVSTHNLSERTSKSSLKGAAPAFAGGAAPPCHWCEGATRPMPSNPGIFECVENPNGKPCDVTDARPEPKRRAS
jgi:hypothetical protein